MIGRQHMRNHSSNDARRHPKKGQTPHGRSPGLSERGSSFRAQLERSAKSSSGSATAYTAPYTKTKSSPPASSPMMHHGSLRHSTNTVHGNGSKQQKSKNRPGSTTSTSEPNIYSTYPMNRESPSSGARTGSRFKHRRSVSDANGKRNNSAPEITIQLQDEEMERGMRLTHYPSSPLASKSPRRKRSSLRNTRSSRSSPHGHGSIRPSRQTTSLRAQKTQALTRSTEIKQARTHQRSVSWHEGSDDALDLVGHHGGSAAHHAQQQQQYGSRRDDNALDMATIEQILSAKRERLAQRERELLQRKAIQTEQLEALRADALEDLNEELEALKQRTNEIQSQVRALRCPGPTPRQMITGKGAENPGPSVSATLPPQDEKQFSSTRPHNVPGIVRVVAARTPPPGGQIHVVPFSGQRSQSPNPSQSVTMSNGSFSAFSSFSQL